MEQKKDDSYVEKYINKIETLKEMEEMHITNLTLRVTTYTSDVLTVLCNHLNIKKSPFLQEPVEDFILKSAKKLGLVDEHGRIDKKYTDENGCLLPKTKK